MIVNFECNDFFNGWIFTSLVTSHFEQPKTSSRSLKIHLKFTALLCFRIKFITTTVFIKRRVTWTPFTLNIYNKSIPWLKMYTILQWLLRTNKTSSIIQKFLLQITYDIRYYMLCMFWRAKTNNKLAIRFALSYSI